MTHEFVPLDQALRAVELEAVREDRRRRLSALERAALTRLRAAARQVRAKRALALLLPVLAALVAMGSIGSGQLHARAMAPSPAETTARLDAALRFGVRRVEIYRERHAQLPPELASIDLRAEAGWSYARLDAEHFQLEIAAHGRSASHDSRTGSHELRNGEETSR